MRAFENDIIVVSKPYKNTNSIEAKSSAKRSGEIESDICATKLLKSEFVGVAEFETVLNQDIFMAKVIAKEHGYNTRSATKRKGSKLEKSSPKRIKLTKEVKEHAIDQDENKKCNSTDVINENENIQLEAESTAFESESEHDNNENQPPMPSLFSLFNDAPKSGVSNTIFSKSSMFSSEDSDNSIFGSTFGSDQPIGSLFGNQRHPLSTLFNSQEKIVESRRTEEEILAEIEANAAKAKNASVSQPYSPAQKSSVQKHMNVYRQLLCSNKWREVTHTQMLFSSGLIEKMECMPHWAKERDSIGYCSIYLVRNPIGRYLVCAVFRSRHIGNPPEKDLKFLGK